MKEDKCVITLFCGENCSQELTGQTQNFLGSNYPFPEISVVETNQPVYDYVIAIE